MKTSIPMQVYYMSKNDVKGMLDDGRANIVAGKQIVQLNFSNEASQYVGSLRAPLFEVADKVNTFIDDNVNAFMAGLGDFGFMAVWNLIGPFPMVSAVMRGAFSGAMSSEKGATMNNLVFGAIGAVVANICAEYMVNGFYSISS
jgi:hypothetical protein